MIEPEMPPGEPDDWNRALVLLAACREQIDAERRQEWATDYGMPPGPERDLKTIRALNRILVLVP